MFPHTAGQGTPAHMVAPRVNVQPKQAVRPHQPGTPPPLDPDVPVPDDPGPLLPDAPDLPPAPHEPSPYTTPAPAEPEPEPACVPVRDALGISWASAPELVVAWVSRGVRADDRQQGTRQRRGYRGTGLRTSRHRSPSIRSPSIAARPSPRDARVRRLVGRHPPPTTSSGSLRRLAMHAPQPRSLTHTPIAGRSYRFRRVLG